MREYVKLFESFSSASDILTGPFTFSDFVISSGIDIVPFWVFSKVVEGCDSVSINGGEMEEFEGGGWKTGAFVRLWGGGTPYHFSIENNETVPVDPTTGNFLPIADKGMRPMMVFHLEFDRFNDLVDFFNGSIDWMPEGREKAKLKRMITGKSAFGM